MRQLILTEYQTVSDIYLNDDEIAGLRSTIPSLSITPSSMSSDTFDLTPGSWVGTIQIGSLAIEIRPKIPLDRLLFLISYTLNPDQWKDTDFLYTEQDSLLAAIAPGFVSHVRRAIHRGVLQGYREHEESLSTVRGRIRFDDQLRDRYGIFPPVEVRYDEFTEDIDENRLLKAALRRLGRLNIRSDPVRRSLRSFDGLLANISSVEFHYAQLPDITWTRLNNRYRSAVDLAKLILRATSFDQGLGTVQSTSFLVDMNVVFEDFVVIALREELGLSERVFTQGARNRRLYLDQAEKIRLRPDISWWDGRRIQFVGDVKYKRINVQGINHPDLYQLLAYTVATGLSSGLLIYAAGEDELASHEIVHAGKSLRVTPLDVSGEPEYILDQISKLARRIWSMSMSEKIESRRSSLSK